MWQRRSGTRIELDGDRLRSLRERNGWTQREVAADLGCTAAAVSTWETESCCPSLPQIARLRLLFGDALFFSGAVRVHQ